MRYLYALIRMAKIWKADDTKCCWECGQRELSFKWECKIVQPPWKTVGQFLTKPNILLPHDLAGIRFGIYPKELQPPSPSFSFHAFSSSFWVAKRPGLLSLCSSQATVHGPAYHTPSFISLSALSYSVPIRALTKEGGSRSFFIKSPPLLSSCHMPPPSETPSPPSPRGQLPRDL